MRIAFRADGLDVEDGAVLETADAVLRGIGQVMFQNNTFAGALFLVGAFAASASAGLAVLTGAVVSTLAAMLLGADRAEVRAGLFGFNGALVGISLAAFFRLDGLLCVYLVIGAALSTVVTAALARLLPAGLPALTAPFVLVTWGLVAARAELAGLHPSAALSAARLAGAAGAQDPAGATTVAEGIVRGVAQVFLQDGLATGASFLLGLLVASRSACAAALAGSSLGLLAAWAFGAAEPALRAGLFGYNAVLSAIALCAFLAPRRAAFAYVAGASVASAVASAAASAVLAPLGVPALTAPFVIVTWTFLLAAPGLSRLARAPTCAEADRGCGGRREGASPGTHVD